MTRSPIALLAALCCFFAALIASAAAATPAVLPRSTVVFADAEVDAITDLTVTIGALPIALGAGYSVTLGVPTSLDMLLNAQNATAVYDADGVDTGFAVTATSIMIDVDGYAQGTTPTFTVTNVQAQAMMLSQFTRATIRDASDVVVAEGPLLWYPVGVAIFGQAVSSIVPANTTAGSGFGQIVLALSPITLAIPAGGSIQFSVPSDWAVAPTLACSAGVDIVDASQAKIALVAVAEGNSLIVSFAAGLPATAGVLRVFCAKAVRVAATPATYPNDYSLVVAYDAAARETMEALAVGFPEITATAPPRKVVSQSATVKKTTLFSAVEVGAYTGVYANVLKFPPSSITFTSQTLVPASSVVKKGGINPKTAADAAPRGRVAAFLSTSWSTLSALAARWNPLAEDPKVLRATVGIAVPAGVSPDALAATINAKSGELAAGLASELGVEIDLDPAEAKEVDGSCFNNIQDNAETDVDCGGPTCGLCAAGQFCVVDADCATGKCSARGRCAMPSPASARPEHAAAAVIAAVVAAVLALAL